MNTLPAQPLKESYWLDVESQIKAILYSVVFAPIVEMVSKANAQTLELVNAANKATDLIKAIRSGRVQYVEGVFSGEFSIAISKNLREMGARFDSRRGVWICRVEDVPENVRIEAAKYQEDAKRTHEQIMVRLSEMDQRVEEAIAAKKIDADSVMARIDSGWRKSAESLEVVPKLLPQNKEKLIEDYNKNLKLYITDFSKKAIANLREDVEENVMEGYRFDRLMEKIRHRYGVSANKARFLATQETSLFLAKFRKERFAQVGVRRYVWRTRGDNFVRPCHKALNGKVFAYDQPPVVTGPGESVRRGNPGEDFNCRCVDKPVLEGSDN